MCKEEQKVAYVVTSGIYSDYSIDMVTLNKNNADEYCKIHNEYYRRSHNIAQDDGNGYDEHEVEEWILDDFDPSEVARKTYACLMNIETGIITNEANGIAMANINLRTTANTPYLRSMRPWEKGYSVYAKSYISFEHARKVAADFRTTLLAERAEGLRDECFKIIEEQENGI